MQPIRDDEIVAKELLYKTIKKHLDSVGKQIDSSHREIIWQTLVQQLSHNEDILAKKSIQALKEIDVKLQREITNFPFFVQSEDYCDHTPVACDILE